MVAANIDETGAEPDLPDINQNFRIERNRQEDHARRRKESQEESLESDNESSLPDIDIEEPQNQGEQALREGDDRQGQFHALSSDDVPPAGGEGNSVPGFEAVGNILGLGAEGGDDGREVDDAGNEIAATLDKVTSGHGSYSVVCTHFYLYGKLNVVLNELTVMEQDDYDSEGAASALIETLSRSLGITRSHLAIILRHAAFDGVYASTEQRTAGGGSLNLVYRFSELLGVEADSITGTWDHAHLLQGR